MDAHGSPNEKLLKRRPRAHSLRHIETDTGHHLPSSFMDKTPAGSDTPESCNSPVLVASRSFLSLKTRGGLAEDLLTGRWIVNPVSSFKLLMIPILLYINWELLGPYVAPNLANPITPLLFISYPIPDSSPDDPRYAKGYLDLAFLAFHIVFYSFLRQFITIILCHPIARYFGIKKQGKLDRFGEQGYALLYFAVMGAWGYRVMGQLPTWWFRTEHFWIGYPHWQMKPELKRYFLMHASYWCQQLIVLLLGLEKPRKDYNELIMHHFVTLWLVGWGYLCNLTLIGNAIYMSMDIPDAFLAFSKLLNYMGWHRLKVASLVVFLVAWTPSVTSGIGLNLVILWSVWFEFDLIDESNRVWAPDTGAWLVWWMKYQMVFPISILQMLNIFWYYLIWRIVIRSLRDVEVTDVRSDDEDDSDDDDDDDDDDEDDSKDTKED
ncbi:longevity assurance proteins LAG1 LAC1 [Suillus paluster]|uniref:longevity assurance proteins LAG1 LAC1 n=1 Tax=Suillus paluster TaxID=48578 RepID=UPI001B87EBD3|nr:longevity assurance proteins LAG1 LAC1 [Suillus paluster]KAG1752705.1 longevity assurance proteins LAG1 LAC1 [Suillus paluster]